MNNELRGRWRVYGKEAKGGGAGEKERRLEGMEFDCAVSEKNPECATTDHEMTDIRPGTAER